MVDNGKGLKSHESTFKKFQFELIITKYVKRLTGLSCAAFRCLGNIILKPTRQVEFDLTAIEQNRPALFHREHELLTQIS